LPSSTVNLCSNGTMTEPIVLVIDDDDVTCRLIQHICGLYNIACVSCPTAHAGICLAQQHKPPVIFIDLNLPGELSGWQAITHLKADTNLSESTLIALTAGDHRQSAADAGSDGYVSKPFTVRQIIDLIEEHR
jgi:CheY-like chemotaxis protein